MRAPRLVAVLLGLAMAMAIAAAAPTLAADPGPSPDPSPAPRLSCAERYPANGPGGVDLQLGCVAAEVVGGYSSLGPSRDPERLSTWLLRLGGVAIGAILLLLAASALRRRAGRRLAPTAPNAWWSCPRCRSLNADHATRCYACGERWTPAALTLDSPTAPPRRADQDEGRSS
jgi:hypothetical protein